jgi:hypothetical protein
MSNSIHFSAKIFLAFGSLFVASLSFAQKKDSLKGIELYTSVARSFASSGDEYGVAFSVGFEKPTSKRGYWGMEALTTIHNSVDPIFYTLSPNSNTIFDGSVRSVTAGIQLGGYAGYQIVSKKQFSIGASLGPILRYQSSSTSDSYSTYYQAVTGLPFPVIVFDHREPMETFAVGGLGKINLRYRIKNKCFFDGFASMQVDTNGDNFMNYGLSFGLPLYCRK